MYGHSGASYGAAPNLSTAKEKGVCVSLEPYSEWKIQEIGYDGVEKFIRYCRSVPVNLGTVLLIFRPESFCDHVGKLSRKVNWRNLVGDDGLYDNPNLVPVSFIKPTLIA